MKYITIEFNNGRTRSFIRRNSQPTPSDSGAARMIAAQLTAEGCELVRPSAVIIQRISVMHYQAR